MLPAFADVDLYTRRAASSAIPAAMMARTPVLVTNLEREAYAYLEEPAFILREEGEDEMEAVARIRKGGAAISGTEHQWAEYERRLLRRNEDALRRILLH